MGGDTADHAYTTVKFTDCHPITWDYIPSSARYQIECPLRWNPSVPVSYVGRWLLFGPVEIPAPSHYQQDRGVSLKRNDQNDR